MLQSHSFPQTALFSQSGSTAWTAASWAYDLILAIGFRILDLRFIPIAWMIGKFALAVLTFVLAGGLRGRFLSAVALSAVAQYILGSIQPGPVYGSILFFALELIVLFESRREGGARCLYWLPPIFLVWVNFDFQFIYGLALLVLFLVIATADTFARHPKSAHDERLLSPATAAVIGVLSFLATLVTPSFYRPYAIFFESLTAPLRLYLPDLHAMTFHRPQDYLLLLLAMAAFLVLGMRRSKDLFQIVVLIGCAILSFYAQRNVWLVMLASVVVIGQAMSVPAQSDSLIRYRNTFIAAGIAVLVLIVASFHIPTSRNTLLAKAAKAYPVQACDYIRSQGLAEPLFNPYEWGGFLTWYLPEYPVAVDSRPGLYGDEFLTQYFKVMNADLPYTALPAMSDAHTILLQRDSLIGKALPTLPAFRVVYKDDVAVVLTQP